MHKLRNFGSINSTLAASQSFFNDLKNRQFVIVHIREITKILKESASGAIRITEDAKMHPVVKNSTRKTSKRKVNHNENVPISKKIKKKRNQIMN